MTSNIINNTIPLVQKLNADITANFIGEALIGVYMMIGVKENEISTKMSSRTTDLLKRVFAQQV